MLQSCGSGSRSSSAAALLRGVGCLAILALLAACAGQGPRTSATQEAARYAAHARGNYTPPGPPEDPWGPYIHEASKRFDVPEIWIRTVMRVESGGNEYLNGQLITSSAGAMGLMQVMPDTYQELRDRYSLGNDPFDPHENILAGTAYMREMYDIYGAPGFLAAYNAGPRRLDDYLSNNRALPDETRRYVAMIGPNIVGVYPTSRSPAEDYAMNALPIDIPPGTALWPRGPTGRPWQRRASTVARSGPDGAVARTVAIAGSAGTAAVRSRDTSVEPAKSTWRLPTGLTGGGRTGAGTSRRFPLRPVGDPGRCLLDRGNGAFRGRHRASAGAGRAGRGAPCHRRRPPVARRAVSRAPHRPVA